MDTAVLPAADLPSGVDAFIWPAPPYREFPRLPAAPEPGQCLVVLSGGRKLQAELLRFDPDEGHIELGLTREPIDPAPKFADLVQLRMLDPVQLRRQELPADISEEEIFPGSEQQTFTIEMASGESTSGETRGFVDAQCGLFLYLPAGGSAVCRLFVPARAMRAFHIGEPIGQLLIEDHVASKEAVAAALQRQRDLRVQKLGDLLTDNQIVTVDELATALRHQQQRPVLRLGEVLIELGLLTAGELANALKMQQKNRTTPLGQILVEMGVVDEEMIKTVLAKKLGIPFVNLGKFRIQPATIAKVPAALAQRRNVIPVFQADASLVVAIENPLATRVLEELRFVTGMKILPVMAEEADIRAAVLKHYAGSPVFDANALETLDFKGGNEGKDGLAFYQVPERESAIDALAIQLAAEGGEVELADEQLVETDNTLVKLVNKVILDAWYQKASDIHIETYPGKKNTRIRFRKDGVLVHYLDLPSKFRSALVSRIKIMATLDISERRKPQDGKIDFSRFGPARLELRVATIPTNNGLEDVVMRLLAAAKPLAIDRLGFSDEVLRDVKRMVAKPHGLCLVCGPTGSGKTTTLHSLLGYINTDERKIWTAEDPVEITQEGLRQVQVNAKIGWTFASAMRSFLRADPDVIMVGEMRDAETTRTGIEASLTGHLVLSTLHTNSAPESIVRLLDMGMDPFNFADALLGILAQRLARRLCTECRQGYEPSAEELEALLGEYCVEGVVDPGAVRASWRARCAGADGKAVLYRATGCAKCGKTGYDGRLGLHELLVADDKVKRLIQTRATVAEIKAAAVAAGMHTLKQNGIEKVLLGLTDIQQVRAVCG